MSYHSRNSSPLTIALTIPLVGLLTWFLLRGRLPVQINSIPYKSHGQLNDALYVQGLSHLAFHAKPFKTRLASLVRRSGEVAVVGVEWGSEVMALGREGFRVHAFEPHEEWHKHLLNRIRKDSIGLDIQVHNIAASEKEGKLKLKYQSYNKLVPTAPLRNFVQSELDVLSVDVQGNELEVLLGARGVQIRSLWIEAFPCSEKPGKILQMLDDDFAIFDFVPWGRPKGEVKGSKSLVEWNSEKWRDRPSEFEPYLDWFCKMSQRFEWLQTDFVAVRRDVLSPSVLNSFSTIANDVIVESSSDRIQ